MPSSAGSHGAELSQPTGVSWGAAAQIQPVAAQCPGGDAKLEKGRPGRVGPTDARRRRCEGQNSSVSREWCGLSLEDEFKTES